MPENCGLRTPQMSFAISPARPRATQVSKKTTRQSARRLSTTSAYPLTSLPAQLGCSLSSLPKTLNQLAHRSQHIVSASIVGPQVENASSFFAIPQRVVRLGFNPKSIAPDRLDIPLTIIADSGRLGQRSVQFWKYRLPDRRSSTNLTKFALIVRATRTRCFQRCRKNGYPSENHASSKGRNLGPYGHFDAATGHGVCNFLGSHHDRCSRKEGSKERAVRDPPSLDRRSLVPGEDRCDDLRHIR
jgi:hypothetical protein